MNPNFGVYESDFIGGQVPHRKGMNFVLSAVSDVRTTADLARDLLAGVLMQAIVDLEVKPTSDDGHNDVTAYLWLTGSDEAHAYCAALDINYLWLRDKVIDRYYDAMAPKLAERKEYADAALKFYLNKGFMPRSLHAKWRKPNLVVLARPMAEAA